MTSVPMFRIPRPFDMHTHLRQGPLMRLVTRLTARHFDGAIVMPNTNPPILTGEDACRYQSDIMRSARGANASFLPLTLIKLTMETTPDIIIQAKKLGVVAAKMYPVGVTTNSADGVDLDKLRELYPTFKAMEDTGMILCIHGEVGGDVFVLDREEFFFEYLRQLHRDFPTLRIVLEHITTKAAVDLVRNLGKTVAASITLHHLFLTLNNVLCDPVGAGEFLRPHHACRPYAKRPEDRDALVRAAISGDPKFFWGTDSAPHPFDKKEADCCAAGVWTTPVALPLLVELFEKHEALERLAGFSSQFGLAFYGIKRRTRMLTMVKRAWTVPLAYDVRNGAKFVTKIVPFRAGQKISWKVARY